VDVVNGDADIVVALSDSVVGVGHQLSQVMGEACTASLLMEGRRC